MQTMLEAQGMFGVMFDIVEALYDMGKLLLVLFSDRILP